MAEAARIWNWNHENLTKPNFLPEYWKNAERFESWGFDEIIPTLRKTGSYKMPKAEKKSEQKRPALSFANMMVKNVMSALEKAKAALINRLENHDSLKKLLSKSGMHFRSILSESPLGFSQKWEKLFATQIREASYWL